MSYTQQLKYETMRSIDSATFTGSYQALGTPITNPSFILKIVNNSSVIITVSVDGTNDHDIVPANSFILYDMSKYGIPTTQFLPANIQFHVKGSAGTGLVYLVTLYNVVR
jgi:hypothetical protein